jgi:hypothetical protein
MIRIVIRTNANVLTNSEYIRHILKCFLIYMPNSRIRSTLRIVYEDRREQNRKGEYFQVNIYISLFSYGFKIRTEFSPSVSIMIRTVSSLILIGSPQIHKPFVQGIVVGPIANPFILLSNRLERKDFPVLCGPAIAAIAT